MISAIKKEWIATILVCLPILYLSIQWNALPDSIPLHSNMKGEVDRWGSKLELLPFTFLPLIVHLILLFITKIRAKEISENYRTIKLVLLGIITVTILALLHTIINRGGEKISFNFIAIGSMILFMSFFMKSIKPNNLFGIRLPWTLNNEEVWNRTHSFASKIFAISGFLIILVTLLLSKKLVFIGVFTIITAAIVTTIVFSFIIHKKTIR